MSIRPEDGAREIFFPEKTIVTLRDVQGAMTPELLAARVRVLKAHSIGATLKELADAARAGQIRVPEGAVEALLNLGYVR